MYMDDIKLLAKKCTKLETLIQAVIIVNLGVGMKSGIKIELC